MEGNHIYCEFEEYFFDILSFDFMQENTITLVEVRGEQFKNFVNAEDHSEAQSFFDTLTFSLMGSVEYGDWDAFDNIISNTIDTAEVETLKRVYFDCDDFKEVHSAVLLYHDRLILGPDGLRVSADLTFVTMCYDDNPIGE